MSTYKDIIVDAGPHGKLTRQQLSGIAYEVNKRILEAHAVTLILDGTGFDSFEDLGEDQQKAVISLICRNLFQASEAAQRLQDILDFARRPEGGKS